MTDPIDLNQPTPTDATTPVSQPIDYAPGLRQPNSSILDNPFWPTVLLAAALLVITIFTYARTFTSGFIWDDDNYVTANQSLRTLDGLQHIWRDAPTRTQYYPAVLTSFWIEYHLWGLQPSGYHAVNVLLQFGNAALLWILLRRLAVPGAWLAAVIFAIHPLQVETVAWISERKNLLSGFFYLLSLMVYLRFCKITPSPNVSLRPGDPEPWWQLPNDPTRLYALVIFLFACALLSKSVTATLPAAILLIIWWKRGRVTLADFTPLIPLFVMGLAMGTFTGFIETGTIGAKGKGWEMAPTHVGDALVRCMIAGRAVWFYAVKLLIPFPLIFNYPRWVLSPSDVAEYLFPISVVAVFVALWLARKRIGRGPLAAVAFFVVTLSPALGFVNFLPMRYSFVADHFQYLACIGLIVLTVAALKRGSDRLVAIDALNPLVAPAVATAALIGFGSISLYHSGTFTSLESLWRFTLDATNQKSWMAANNYGVWLLKRGNPGDREVAARWFQRTLKLNPGDAEARYSLGKLAAADGRFAEALQLFQDSMAQSPPYPDSEFEIVQMLMRLGRNGEALAAAKALVEHNPKNAQALGAYGMLLARNGQVSEAMDQYAAAVDADPLSAIAHFNYASALQRVGRIRDALQEYGKTIQLDNKEPTFITSFGTAELMGGNVGTAEKLFKTAIDVDPKFIDAYLNLGLLYQQELKLKESEAILAKAAEIDPKNTRIETTLKRTREWIADPSKRPTTLPFATTRSATTTPTMTTQTSTPSTAQ